MGRHLKAILFVALALLAVTPTAIAETITGDLTIRSARFPDGAQTSIHPEAAIIRLTERTEAVLVSAPRLHVIVYEKPYLEVPGGPAVQQDLKQRSYTITNAIVARTSGTHDGYLGMYPEETATLNMTGHGAMNASLSMATRMEDGGQRTSDDPRSWWYLQQIEGPHGLYTTSGSAVLDGPSAIKIHGLDVTIQGAENATAEIVRTGRFQDDPLHSRQVWLYLEAASLHVEVAGDAPLEAAARGAASLAWTGEVTLKSPGGNLRASGATYTPTRDEETLDGRLTATLTPNGDGRSGRLLVNGDLGQTTLARVPLHAPLTPGAAASLWVLGAVVGSALPVGGLVAVLAHRRGAQLEEALRKADEAEDADEWEDALHWLQEARRLRRKDADLALREATALRNLDRSQEALAAYDAAALLSGSHEAPYWAGILCVHLGEFDAAETYLKAALDRNSGLHADIEADPLLALVRASASFQEALWDARRATVSLS